MITVSPYIVKKKVTFYNDPGGPLRNPHTVDYDRMHDIYTPYTTVFPRITWSRMTVVDLRDLVWWNAECRWRVHGRK